MTSRRDQNHQPCSTRDRLFTPSAERHSIVVVGIVSCQRWIGDAGHAGVCVAWTCPGRGIVTSCRHSVTCRKSSSWSPTVLRALEIKLSTRGTSQTRRSSRSRGHTSESPARPVTAFRFPAFRNASSGCGLSMPRPRCAVAQLEDARRTRLCESTWRPCTAGCMPWGRSAGFYTAAWPPAASNAWIQSYGTHRATHCKRRSARFVASRTVLEGLSHPAGDNSDGSYKRRFQGRQRTQQGEAGDVGRGAQDWSARWRHREDAPCRQVEKIERIDWFEELRRDRVVAGLGRWERRLSRVACSAKGRSVQGVVRSRGQSP